jgi:hypothetical protein
MVEERIAKFGQGVTIRRGEANAGDDNPLLIFENGGHGCEWSTKWSCKLKLVWRRRKLSRRWILRNLEPIG